MRGESRQHRVASKVDQFCQSHLAKALCTFSQIAIENVPEFTLGRGERGAQRAGYA